jgi:hypothetical protein
MSHRGDLLKAILDEQEKSLLEIERAINRLNREIEAEIQEQVRFDNAIKATRALIKQEELDE